MVLCTRERFLIKRFLELGYTKTAAVELFGRSRTTITAVARARSVVGRRVNRAPKPSIVARRKAVAKAASQISSKGDRQWRTLASSARAIKFALGQHENVEVSRRTIQRDLNTLNMKYRVRRRVPTRSKEDFRRRLVFAKKYANIRASRVVFSDECWLTCLEATSRGEWCPPGSPPFPIERKLRYNVPSVMVWAAVGHGWRSPLVFLPRTRNDGGETTKWTLNGPRYIRMCLSKVREKLSSPGVLFLQDGARCHDNAGVRKYFARHGIQQVEDYPANSPDFNVIELLWSHLKAEIGRKCPMTLPELKKVATEVWEGMPQSMIDKFISRWPAILKEETKRK